MDRVGRSCSKSWLIYRLSLVILLYALLLSRSIATTPPDTILTEDYYFKDIPIVTSATRIPQPVNELPVSTSIITREMIDATGFVEIADLLRLVPGFQVAHATGWAFSVTSHGQAAQFPNNLLVMVNGRSVYIPLISTNDWTALGIDINDIEKIIVVRGSNVPAYGSNAFMGVIDIITKRPITLSGTNIYGLAGSQDTGKALFQYGNEIGNHDFSLEMGYRQDEGFDLRDDYKKIGLFRYHGVQHLGSNSELDIQLGVSGGLTGGDGDDTIWSPYRERDVESDYQYLKYAKELSVDEEFYIQFYRNHYYQTDEYDMGGPLSEIIGVPPDAIPILFPGQQDQILKFSFFDGTAERYDLEALYRKKYGNKFTAAIGLGARLDRIKAGWHAGTNDYINDQMGRAFFNTEYRLTENNLFNVGGMYEANESFEDNFSPRIAYNHLINKNNSLRLSYTKAYRKPGLLERNFNWFIKFNDGEPADNYIVTADKLNPEEIRSYELGFVSLIPKYDLSTDIKIYKEEVRNVVAWARNPDFPDFFGTDGAINLVNDGYIDIEGIELQIKYTPSPKTFLSFAYAYAEVDGQVLNNTALITYDERSKATPKHTLSLLGSYLINGGYEASAGYYFMSENQWLGDGGLVNDYHRVDVRVAKHFLFTKTDFTIEAVVQNILGDYTEFNEDVSFNPPNIFDTRFYVNAHLSI